LFYGHITIGQPIVTQSSANHHDIFYRFPQSAATSKGRCGNKVTDELNLEQHDPLEI